jgi:hypothetical protein
MYFIYLLLHLFSIVGSFYLAALVLPNYNKLNMDEEEILEKEMIEHCKRHMFTHMYLDEVEALENVDSSMCLNKNNVVTLDIPFLNNTIIMYYDVDKEAFCYYTKGDIIYKYLNVACRKYVIEYNCKHLYLSGESQMVQTMVNSDNKLFVKKIEKQLLHKNTNKFILCGSLDDYYKSLIVNEDNDIDIIDFLSMKDS